MLKKKQRLSRSEFGLVLKTGKRIHSEHFSLMYRTAESSKYGLVVSKKIAKKATIRNRIRRQLYAIFGECAANVTNRHVVLLTKPTITSLQFSDLKQEVCGVFKKLL
jgi:ribonuclease P protein component